MTTEKTHAVKVLEAINALIEKRATSDHQSYVVNGMSVTKMKLDELLSWKKYYERIVAREEKPKSNKIHTRFVDGL